MNRLTRGLSLYLEGLRTPVLKKKILITLGILVFFRFLAHIPVPGVNLALLKSFFAQNQLLSLLDIFSNNLLFSFHFSDSDFAPGDF